MNIEDLEQIITDYKSVSDDFIFDNKNKAIHKSEVQRMKAELDFNQINYTSEYFEKTLGRKWRLCLIRMLKLVSYLYLTKSKYVPIQISTTNTLSKFNLSNHINNTISNSIYNSITISKNIDFETLEYVYKNKGTNTYHKTLDLNFSQQIMSDIIDDLCKIHILARKENDFEMFNQSNPNDNCSYTYMISEYNINSYLSIMNIQYHNSNYISNSITISKNIDFGIKHTKLYKEWLPKVKYELERQKTEGIFRYTLSENGSRPYCDFCSQFPLLENQVDDYNKYHNTKIDIYEYLSLFPNTLYRHNILHNYFTNNLLSFNNNNIITISKNIDFEWNEWDRSASVYNITYSYNKKKYLPNEIDLHEKFYGKKFESSNERKLFKLGNMTRYFSNKKKFAGFIDYIMSASNQYFELRDKRDNNMISEKEFIKLKKLIGAVERFIAFMKCAGLTGKEQDWKERLINYYEESKKQMFDFIGKKLPKDAIFIIEATINLATMNDLNDLGYKAVSVYDGFYTNCFDNELIEKIYKNNVIKYLGVKE